MKILVISSSYPRFHNDQLGFFIHDLNKKLSGYHQIFVLVPYKDGSSFEEEFDGIKIFRFKQFPFANIGLGNPEFGILESIKKNPFRLFILFSYLFYLIKSVRNLIKNYNIDIIHYHWIIPSGMIHLLVKWKNEKLKSIVTIHGSDYWVFNNKFSRRIKFFFLRQFDAIVCVSEAMSKDMFIHKLNKKNVVIPMGINTRNFIIQPKLNESNTIDILFVGKANKAKGFDILINSINILRNLYHKIKLVAITQSIDADLMNNLEEQFIFDFTTLTGRISNNETIDYYNNCDIFILPSLSEGWPVVVMEALSCGCICIVTDIPAFEEYKDQYEFLHVVEKANPKALADKIMQIYNNYDYYKQFKIEAREFAVNNFDWKIIATKYLDVFDEVLNEKN